MEDQKIIVGLDIGTTKVCAIVGQMNPHGNINILGVGRAENEGVRRGVIDNIEKTEKAIRLAVSKAQQQSEVEVSSVYVGIAGEHIRSTQMNGIITRSPLSDAEITQDDLKRLYNDMRNIQVPPGTEILHIIPQEYIVDNQPGITEPIGMSGVRIEGKFHIVTAQSASARNIYKCVCKAGLDIVDLVLQPLASSYSVLSEEELEAGVCLVDIGGGTTDIAIFENNIIRHTAVIPFGGNIITEDIKQGCSIMKKQAESIKMSAGSALEDAVTDNEIISIVGLQGRNPKEISRRMLAAFIQARMEEIIEFVAREIRNSGYWNKLVGGIVITGGGSQLRDIDGLFSYVTGLDARIGYPRQRLAQGMVEEASQPAYATATGLVIYGLMNQPGRMRPEEAAGMAATNSKAGATATATQTATARKTSTVAPTEVGFVNTIRRWFERSVTPGGPNLD
jgi:cell division protein FtsA